MELKRTSTGPYHYAANTGPNGVACDVCATVGSVDLATIKGGPQAGERILLCRRCKRKPTCELCGRRANRLILQVGSSLKLCGRCSR